MNDVIDGEYTVVEPAYRPFKFRWFTTLYSLAFYAGCIAVAASNEEPATRGAAAFGAAIFWPSMRFFGLAAQRVTEQEAQQLRSRLLSRPASVWERASGRRDKA